MSWEVIQGDCLDVMRSMPDNSVDSVVTDPPYGLSQEPDISEVLSKWMAGEDYTHRGGGFMGKSWDSFVPGPAVWREMLRVMKPGAHALMFCGTRTHDLMGISLRLAGFQTRDTIHWIVGSGFPKSHDISKAIDRMAGAEREVVGIKHAERYPNGPGGNTFTVGGKPDGTRDEPQPEAEQWQGYGTALKPSHELVLLVRKPLAEKSIAANVLAWGTGAINVDGCRVEATDKDQYEKNNAPWYQWQRKNSVLEESKGMNTPGRIVPGKETPAGRWPPNTLLSTHAAAALDAQSGVTKSKAGDRGKPWSNNGSHEGWKRSAHDNYQNGYSSHNDQGGCSRFFPVFEPEYDVPFRYVAKASRRERNAGLEGLPEINKGSNFGMDGARPHTKPDYKYEARTQNPHPTVKPVRLMEWLVRLVTPPDGVCLDPFCGSGSTGVASVNQGFSFIGIEREAEYAEIARRRIEHAAKQVKQLELATE